MLARTQNSGDSGIATNSRYIKLRKGRHRNAPIFLLRVLYNLFVDGLRYETRQNLLEKQS